VLSFDDKADDAKEKALTSYLDQIDQIEMSQRWGRQDAESSNTISSQEDQKGEQSHSNKSTEVSRGLSPSGSGRGYWRL
jgi:Mor family transcriptional regulator